MWHLPLFFIDSTAQGRNPMALFMPSVVAMSVVLAWLVDRSAGSARAYGFAVAMLCLLAALAWWLTPDRPHGHRKPA